jgi:hypothetical protein
MRLLILVEERAQVELALHRVPVKSHSLKDIVNIAGVRHGLILPRRPPDMKPTAPFVHKYFIGRNILAALHCESDIICYLYRNYI